jgi:hypothetical protein
MSVEKEEIGKFETFVSKIDSAPQFVIENGEKIYLNKSNVDSFESQNKSNCLSKSLHFNSKIPKMDDFNENLGTSMDCRELRILGNQKNLYEGDICNIGTQIDFSSAETDADLKTVAINTDKNYEETSSLTFFESKDLLIQQDAFKNMVNYNYFNLQGANYFMFPLYGILEKSIQTELTMKDIKRMEELTSEFIRKQRDFIFSQQNLNPQTLSSSRDNILNETLSDIRKRLNSIKNSNYFNTSNFNSVNSVVQNENLSPVLPIPIPFEKSKSTPIDLNSQKAISETKIIVDKSKQKFISQNQTELLSKKRKNKEGKKYMKKKAKVFKRDKFMKFKMAEDIKITKQSPVSVQILFIFITIILI